MLPRGSPPFLAEAQDLRLQGGTGRTGCQACLVGELCPSGPAQAATRPHLPWELSSQDALVPGECQLSRAGLKGRTGKGGTPARDPLLPKPAAIRPLLDSCFPLTQTLGPRLPCDPVPCSGRPGEGQEEAGQLCRQGTARRRGGQKRWTVQSSLPAMLGSPAC